MENEITCTFQVHGLQFLVYFAMLLVWYFRTKLVQNLRKIIVRVLNVLVQENLVLRQYHSIEAISCKPIKINLLNTTFFFLKKFRSLIYVGPVLSSLAMNVFKKSISLFMYLQYL